MNVRVRWLDRPNREVLFTSISRVDCDGRFHPGSGARLWLKLTDGRDDDSVDVPIGGRHGGIVLAMDEDGADP